MAYLGCRTPVKATAGRPCGRQRGSQLKCWSKRADRKQAPDARADPAAWHLALRNLFVPGRGPTADSPAPDAAVPGADLFSKLLQDLRARARAFLPESPPRDKPAPGNEPPDKPAEADGDSAAGSSAADEPPSSAPAVAPAPAPAAAPARTAAETLKQLRENELLVTTHRSIHEFDQAEWNACACGGHEVNPFLLWEFLAALEDSQSVAPSQGWLPQHVAVRDGSGGLLAAVPMYLKSHSYGEYVFDNAWANLYAQMGEAYYPKLQACVPFTPVTGPRILLAPTAEAHAVRAAVLQCLTQVADAMKVSSLHITFNSENEWQRAQQAGWLSRIGLQYHWDNDGYGTFDDFLAALKQSKRKSIRQERNSIAKQGLHIRRLRGADVTPEVWDAFYDFYTDTVDRKWGSAYLTRDFFRRLGATMGDRVLLVGAYDSNRGGGLVAAALNLVGSHALFGRNWGCRDAAAYKNLHFELCYYQAIEAAIELGLQRVEAGAQGQHKISRGYLPTTTYSSHWVRSPRAAFLIRQFLRREAIEMEYTIEALTAAASPFKAAPADAVEAAFAGVKGLAAQQAADNPTAGAEAGGEGETAGAWAAGEAATAAPWRGGGSSRA